jgi:hypothetical protein
VTSCHRADQSGGHPCPPCLRLLVLLFPPTHNVLPLRCVLSHSPLPRLARASRSRVFAGNASVPLAQSVQCQELTPSRVDPIPRLKTEN